MQTRVIFVLSVVTQVDGVPSMQGTLLVVRT